MASRETKVLVRYLVQENEQQFLLARKLIHAAVRAGETLHIPIMGDAGTGVSSALEFQVQQRAGDRYPVSATVVRRAVFRI